MIKAAALIAGLTAAGTAAHAGSVGFDLTISGNTNVPTFKLQNTSTSAELTAFSITIGLIGRNFDFVQSLTNPSGGTSTRSNGDAVDDGDRVNRIFLSFTDFDVGETVSWVADIDPDSSNAIRDYRDTLFNNGPGPNSVL